MAFHAELHGYIARKEAEEIPPGVLEEVRRSSMPLFSYASFSAPNACRMGYYTSFACSIRFNEDDDELWIAPFETLLKRINFLHAAVVIDHEESSGVVMYSYVKLDTINKHKVHYTAQLMEESEIG